MGGFYKIKWTNIWHMLMYTVDELQYMRVGNANLEDIQSLDELLAKLMEKSLEVLYDNNLLRDYKRVSASTSKPKGKLLIYESMRSGDYEKGKIKCKYFKFSIDSYQNRIIKAAINTLLLNKNKMGSVIVNRLNEVIDDMGKVEDVDAYELLLEDLDFSDEAEWYKPALMTSIIIIQNMLCKDEKVDPNKKMFDLDNMDRLKYIYQTFVGNFYKREYTECTTSTKEHFDSGFGNNRLDMLLYNDAVAFIIDTKWYQNIKTHQYNYRQMLDYCTCLSERDTEEIALGKRSKSREIISTLLYVQNEDGVENIEKAKDNKFVIAVRSIDMDQEFEKIKADLIALADGVFKRTDEKLNDERTKITNGSIKHAGV